MALTSLSFAVPAVRNFAIYAAGAVLVNALLQVTIFVSAMAIDLRRIEVSGRRPRKHKERELTFLFPRSPTASIGE